MDQLVVAKEKHGTVEPHAQQQQPLEANKPFLQWTPETVQTPEMERVEIVINTTTKVIVCLDCKSVAKPTAIHHHINHTHHLVTATKKYCSSLILEYDLITEPT